MTSLFFHSGCFRATNGFYNMPNGADSRGMACYVGSRSDDRKFFGWLEQLSTRITNIKLFHTTKFAAVAVLYIIYFFCSFCSFYVCKNVLLTSICHLRYYGDIDKHVPRSWAKHSCDFLSCTTIRTLGISLDLHHTHTDSQSRYGERLCQHTKYPYPNFSIAPHIVEFAANTFNDVMPTKKNSAELDGVFTL